MAKHRADFEEVEDLNPQQRDARRFAERIERRPAAYEAWGGSTNGSGAEPPSSLPSTDALTTHEASARSILMVYATEGSISGWGGCHRVITSRRKNERREQLGVGGILAAGGSSAQDIPAAQRSTRGPRYPRHQVRSTGVRRPAPIAGAGGRRARQDEPVTVNS